MGFIGGVHLLPATGEFTYDTIPHTGARGRASRNSALNTFYAPGGTKTDYSYAIDQLQAAHPECTTVSVVCAWFGNSLDASSCQHLSVDQLHRRVVPARRGRILCAGHWRVSGLTQGSSGPHPAAHASDGSAVYGGTPSDPSIVRCIRDLKARGFKVVFYPFILMTAAGYPWRGRITYGSDLSAAATNAVNAFLGSAARSAFTPDPVNLTVAYSGSPTDYSYRRMILHYAMLCAVAGGVDLFLIGSELRGLETLRGPAWTKAGTTDGSGYAIWDYPFVAGLGALADDVRAIFDSQGLTRRARSRREPHRLFRRLVGLDGLAAPWRRTGNGRILTFCGPIQTSMSSVSTITSRCRTGRLATAAWTPRTGSPPRPRALGRRRLPP